MGAHNPAVDGNGTRELAEFASALTFEDLPKAVVHQAKRSILDSIGCGLFGSTLPWSQLLLDVLQAQGSVGGSVAWGTAARLNVADAALVNGTYTHGFELDDVHQGSYTHFGSAALPATIALAEHSGRKLTGRDLIVAQIAGYEVGIRIALAGARGMINRGFHPTGIVGAMAAAVSAARLLRLDPDGTQDALGTSGSLSSGLGGAQYGSSVKRMHSGRAAQSGVYCAMLAAEKFRGIRDLFELPHGGAVGSFTSADDWNRAELTKGLGSRWHSEQIGFKMFAACAASHTSIESALDLVESESVSAEDIESITVQASAHVVDHVGWKYEPDTVTTAQMNLPFAVASAFLDGKSSVEQFAQQRLDDPAVVALADRVHVKVDPAAADRPPALRNAISMSVTLRDGRELTASHEQMLGNEHRPVDDAKLSSKFDDLARHAVDIDTADRVRNLALTLETCDDLTELTSLLAVRP